MNKTIIQADYHNSQHAEHIVFLMDAYACDVMGGGTPLSDSVKQNLVPEMAKRPQLFSFLCYVDDQPASLVNCVEGFSTFSAKPLLNIHDVIVLDDFRGQGISQMLLQQVEDKAKSLGCCKVTLEVLEGNHIAQQSYHKFGFAGYELDPTMGKAMFWQKAL